MHKIHRIKVLGLLSLPLLAIALAVVIFTWGSQTDSAEAATGGAAMSLSIPGSETQTCPSSKVSGETCVALGSVFHVIVKGDAIPLSGTPPGYKLAQAFLDFGALDAALTFKPTGSGGAVAVTIWPDCAAADLGTSSATTAQQGCLTGLANPPASIYKGDLFNFEFTCSTTKSSNQIDLVSLGTAPAGTSGAAYTASDGTIGQVAVPGSTLLVNCTNPNTPTPTPTDTPTPTATPTATPPDFPKMSKIPALQNVWLTTQGSKIPPTSCNAGTDIGTLSEQLSLVPVTFNPKGDLQDNPAAFEFEVHYDATKVCVNLTEGSAWSTAGAICIIQDSVSKPQLEGVARIGCVTQGKGANINALDALATIDVGPQPDVYSQAKPNQDNGVVVQINNVGCDLSDEQGHAIALFSCDDADITFRYLEGDVLPDCAITAADAQAVAFRWGTTKGSTIYRDFMNLEPSGTQADNDIDINDLQFVYGRFGSSCSAPHPPQPPVNPKAQAPAP